MRGDTIQCNINQRAVVRRANKAPLKENKGNAEYNGNGTMIHTVIWNTVLNFGHFCDIFVMPETNFKLIYFTSKKCMK